MTKQITIKSEEAIKRYWRPAMAWQYFIVCLFDFMIGPIFYTYVQLGSNQPLHQWTPMTLNSGGLYHIAMGGMIGIYTWVRSLEKIDLQRRGIFTSNPYEPFNTITPQQTQMPYDPGMSMPISPQITPGVPYETSDQNLADPRTPRT